MLRRALLAALATGGAAEQPHGSRRLQPEPEPEPEPEQAPDHKTATETTKNPVARNCDDPNKPMRSKFEEPSTAIV